ncbi:DUF305 domain-containing protein [Desulfuromonas sp. CSMB_57]|jgi:uncharacterized protein (DUF305 family)|uniref:DUF305 domain-containing protein n=1 Tax=Desulfuromonas sp. CSMB_57 TaxID=2807629 RepID=UPI001CD27F61|nr:DUF305 domain-containing protein [Desulfuromonas sp. CSMB_57]
MRPMPLPPLLAGCLLAFLTALSLSNTAFAQNDHAHHPPRVQSGLPYDALFIDSMIGHHQGAVEMARALQNQTRRPELLTMAGAIIDTQQSEIEFMTELRRQLFPDLPMTSGLAMDMGAMAVAPEDGRPYEQRFLEAMISHHEGAIAMAGEALQLAKNADLKDLAAEIIRAQKDEIATMRQWLRDWFGVAP